MKSVWFVAREKLGIGRGKRVKLVLNKDGTQVEDSDVLKRRMEEGVYFQLICDGETWKLDEGILYQTIVSKIRTASLELRICHVLIVLYCLRRRLFSLRSVCLSACLSLHRITEKVVNGF